MLGTGLIALALAAVGFAWYLSASSESVRSRFLRPMLAVIAAGCCALSFPAVRGHGYLGPIVTLASAVVLLVATFSPRSRTNAS